MPTGSDVRFEVCVPIEPNAGGDSCLDRLTFPMLSLSYRVTLIIRINASLLRCLALFVGLVTCWDAVLVYLIC